MFVARLSHHGRTPTQGFLSPETQRNMCLTYQAAIRGCRYAAVVRTARLQVSCTVYCSVPSHCLADFVEPSILASAHGVAVALALAVDASAVAVPVASVVSVAVDAGAGSAVAVTLVLFLGLGIFLFASKAR